MRVTYKGVAFDIPSPKVGAKIPCPCGCNYLSLTCGACGAAERIILIGDLAVISRCPVCHRETELPKLLEVS